MSRQFVLDADKLADMSLDDLMSLRSCAARISEADEKAGSDPKKNDTLRTFIEKFNLESTVGYIL